MAVTRRGMVATAVALFITISAGILALTLATRAAGRRVEVAERVARAQGREWCLGATALAPGASVAVGAWTIAREADGARQASGPRGTYRILVDGAERWRATGATR